MKKFLMAFGLASIMCAPAFAAGSDAASGGAYEAIVNGRWTEAESMLRAGLAQNPNDPARLLNLAFVLQKMGRPGEAAGVYQQVLKLDQNPLVSVDDPYVLSRPARARQLARQGMAQVEKFQR